MRATPLLRERQVLGEGRFAEIVIWRVRSPVLGSAHAFKYSLAFVVEGECVLRFDNEAGKGDHKHLDGLEAPYMFQSLGRLVEDFWVEAGRWRV